MATSHTQPLLTAAALAYAGSTVFASAVALREDIPGEPFGISAPFSVSTGLAVGWGAGIAPPWFMPLAALLAANRAAEGRPAPALAASAIGAASIAGHLIEPVTRRPGSWTWATTVSIAFTMCSSGALAAAGYARYRTAGATTAGPVA